MPAHVALDTEATATAFVRTCECCRARQNITVSAPRSVKSVQDTHVSPPCEYSSESAMQNVALDETRPPRLAERKKP